ncbi:MAG: ATP-binding cassette domain-containing protein [Alphaproteobacteria bacterium]|nr:ATP-binding cassette domain-containing protein [Alphaproteobacteria bacterium]MDE2109956.1 ATP-binding cassette domain-containing protein [Alphaproteobacteria bacterium]MDE2496109.1 ATP-binding cassette domain-containing protein [Alphaproteobacteria bacterium]
MAQSGAEYAEQLQRAAAGRAKSRSLTPLRGLLPFLRPYRWTIVAAVVAMLVAATATLILPLAGRGLIDHGFNAAEAAQISQYFLAFLAVAAVMGVSAATRYYFVTWTGERVIADLRKAVFDNVIALTPSFFEVTRTGEVLSRLTADTTLIQTVIGSSASVAARNAVTLTGGLIMMFVTSAKLSALVLGAVALVMVPLMLFGRWVRSLSRKSQDKIADTSAHASETINAVQTVQAFTHEAQERKVFGTAVEDSVRIAILRTRARAVMSGVVIFAVFAAIVCVGWVGAHDVITHRTTGGNLLQFILYAILVAGGVGALSETWGDIQRAAGASERLMELLHAKPDIAAPAHPQALPAPAHGAVSVRGVTLRYPSRPEYAALDGFSLDIEPGEAVALVGPSGAGKSSVFQILLRFYPIQGGQVFYDGVDIADLDPIELRRHISIVAQDPVIFSGTLADNIRYGRPEAGDDDVRRAAEAAAASEFVAALPKGLETLVGERGITLSGGQRQRIAIARAILRDAPLLLLDEATSALDAENERLVQLGLANLMTGRTTIVIAHRLATIQRLKRIIVMDQGRVVGEGSHAELVARGGLYARLANLQFSSAAALAG